MIKHILCVWCLWSVLAFFSVEISFAEEKQVFFREDFTDLKLWEPLYFKKIPNHSTYTVVLDGDRSILKAESSASASGIIFNKKFDVYRFPVVRWRWKIENVYRNGDAKSKEGDDYPIRIYIMFTYDPAKASFSQKLKYKTAKMLLGEYPPHSTLNYIWANKVYEEKILISTYSRQARMILLQAGGKDAGTWKEESIHIIDDYQRAFGEEPPVEAQIAIMNDSDNTGERSVSYVDYIEVTESGSTK